MILRVSLVLLVSGVLLSCSSKAISGPDKQGGGTWSAAAIGAGSGAVLGAQYGAGGGAVLGAGFGAIIGMLQGVGIDLLEEERLLLDREETQLRNLSLTQEVLAEHYARRLELHPGRDIFPADLFFESDEVVIKKEAKPLVREIAALWRRRMPWSRILIAAYTTSENPKSKYGVFLSKRRAEAIVREFVRAGVQPRRLLARGEILREPVLIDSKDHPNRYYSAVEIVLLDH